ncbi:hypothetical protein SF1_19100 [Sphingobacterium faecium NBRC 15299]|nr:hypothetical protein C8N37_10673 [Sphingobacterium faecium]GEM63928.1 hypothetical protein SF1_19100 [Sphingobacterium faecium NBRC 15299]
MTRKTQKLKTLLSKSPNEISIVIYNTEYRLVKNGESWLNKHYNKMSMSSELAEAIVKTG